MSSPTLQRANQSDKTLSWQLRRYVVADTALRFMSALDNLFELPQTRRCGVDGIDLLAHSWHAAGAPILALPTLARSFSRSSREIIGDSRNDGAERVSVGLAVRPLV